MVNEGAYYRAHCAFVNRGLSMRVSGTLSRIGRGAPGLQTRGMFTRSRTLENTDPLLHPFLQATDESEAQRLMEQLIGEHAQPLVREIACSKLHTARPA